MRGSGISWDMCKSAPSSRQDNHTSTPWLSFFCRPDALPAAQPTASKHWKQIMYNNWKLYNMFHQHHTKNDCCCIFKQLGCLHDTACICCCSANAAECWRLLSIDISCPQGAQQQTHSSCCRMVGQTDMQTDTQPFHTSCSAHYTGKCQ